MTGPASRRDLIWAIALIVLLGAVWLARGDVARAGSPGPLGVDVVYVAVGSNFPDALGAGPLGGVNGAPLIVVPTDPPLPTVTRDELIRLDPKRVIIVGGTGVVSQAMEDAIAAELNIQTEFERIAGANRYETNVLLSESLFPVTRYASIPGTGFVIDGPVANVQYDGHRVWTTDGSDLVAALVLPDGAIVRTVTVLGFDSDAGNGGAAAGDDLDVTFEFATESVTSGYACPELDLSAGAFRAVACDFTDNAPSIVNANYVYQIRVSGADGNPDLRGVIIEYWVGVPEPLA